MRVDADFMALAVSLGARGLGTTAPNPAVGCVLVRDGQIVGEGWHHRAGEAHAEINALEAAGEAARGSTAFVTLEPCNHTGRTGPCAQALIDAGVTRVVVGSKDPNPEATGGIATLRAAGIPVRDGVLRAQCDRLIEPFAMRVQHGRPQITLKVATTLDGRVATSTGHSQWVTSKDARADVHAKRARADAVIVGGATLRADDPALTTRLVQGRHARRIVLSASAEVPGEAKLFTDDAAETWLVTTHDHAAAAANRLTGVRVLPAAGNDEGLDLAAVFQRLGAEGINSVLVEAGQALSTSLLSAGLVDRMACYVAPRIVGGDGLAWAGPLGISSMDGAISLEDVEIRPLGVDVCIEGRCVYRNR